MSRIQSMRLGQFWTHRLAPLLKPGQGLAQFHSTELFEAAGWLAEGVFCRYFDAVDADVVWIRLSDALSVVEIPVATLGAETVEKILALIRARQPFRDGLQMTQGAQRQFEQRLFPVALLLADRFAGDRLARMATAWLWTGPEDETASRVVAHSSAKPAEVVALLSGEATNGSHTAETLAGCLRLAEHMQASAEFFTHAALSARGSSVDFESYCERIGGLNAWRVPLLSQERVTRFRILWAHVQELFHQEVAEKDWPVFQELFVRHLTSIRDAWEEHHLQGFFAH
jgi:hypothetical protein